METSTVQAIKLAFVSGTGLGKDALHVYVGLTVFFVTAAVFRRSVRSIAPWIAVLVVAVVGEIFDMRDDVASLGYWRWRASLHDVLNTLCWPTVIMMLLRFSSLFGRTSEQNIQSASTTHVKGTHNVNP